MVRYHESTDIFHFKWEEVAQGFWKRYPNPESGHVLTEDTLERAVLEGKLYSRRLLTKTNRLPKWGERFFPERPVVRVLEDSVLDPKERRLVTVTRNLGYLKLMSFVERVVYKEREGGRGTLVERSLWVDSPLPPGIGTAVKAFTVERYKKNTARMANGFRSVLQAMFPKEETNGSQGTVQPNNKPYWPWQKIFIKH